MRRLASQRPIAFGVLVTFLLPVLYIVAGVTAMIISTSALGIQAVISDFPNI
jgi:hypothetical protein